MSGCGRVGKWCRYAPFLVLVLLPAVLSGCASTGKSTTAPPGGAPPATTAAGVPTSSTIGPTGSNDAIPGGCPNGIGAAAQAPEQAARCLYQAWARADRAGAAVFASLDVVMQLFSTPWTPPTGTFLGCSPQSDGGQRCGFEQHGGRYGFVVRRSEGGWRVTQEQPPGA
jgi:hypothetical protein